MASNKQEKQRNRDERLRRQQEAATRRQRARRLTLGVGGVMAAAVAGLAVIFALSTVGPDASSQAGGKAEPGKYAYAVGKPGPGQPAPRLRLTSTTGGTWDLSGQRGKTTLVYFQEGIGCQPCWDQIKDLERRPGALKALGIDELVSVTGNELGDLQRKVSDEGIKTRVLADPGLQQSAGWEANQYGMMGNSANGHSFMLVGPDGKIKHRADYGGPPNFTMYVPVDALFADLGKSIRKGPAA